jgi:hypothetical protein
MWRYIVAICLALWFLVTLSLDWAGRVETAKHLFEKRGEILAAIGTFLTWKWSPVIVFAVLVAIWLAVHYLPTLASGAPSPTPTATQQQSTGAVSGGSTVNQATGNSTIINAPGNATIINITGNVTIINPGVAPATVQKTLSDAAAAMRPDLLNKYPLGYILVGAASGELIFQPEPVVLHFGDEHKVSMTINEKTKTLRFEFVYFKLGAAEWPKGVIYENVALNLPLLDEPMEGYRAKFPIELNIGKDLKVTTWLEVVDLDKKIFVVGFTNE